MNDTELHKLLKSASAPKPPPEFWEQLPRRITAKLHWQANRGPVVEAGSRGVVWLSWALCAAVACLVSALLFVSHRNTTASHETAGSFAAAEKCYRESELLFPNQIQSIVFDKTGPRIVLAEKSDVPVSPPLYLKICGPNGCQEIVTFSGQQVRVNGDDCDVLTDAAGNVILAGRQLIWTSQWHTTRAGSYHIEARAMEASS